MAKDVNIHLKTRGAEKTKEDFRGVGAAGRKTGEDVAGGQKQGGRATDQASAKLGIMGRTIGRLKTQVFSLVGAWLGMQGLQRIFAFVIARLERILELQKQIYQKSLALSEVGQALEFQTGTAGRQREWTRRALELQKAGGFPTIDVASQMLVSMDIAFAKHGGIKQQWVRDLGKQLAPFIGAASMAGPEVGKLFEFAGTAGVEPTAEAYKAYLAKLHAGYTASKATIFGQFMVGLQKGGTAYIGMGGTLDEAISTFVSARSVTANESLAASLMEQASRLAGGAYEKPRAAMEKALGVDWSTLTMGQKMQSLLKYVSAIPESQRIQRLTQIGFPAELTTQISKLVSPEAVGTMAQARDEVLSATADTLGQTTDAYLKSTLGKARVTDTRADVIRTAHAEKFADWQNRLTTAKGAAEDAIATTDLIWMKDSIAPHVLAMIKLSKDIEQFSAKLPEGPLRGRAEKIRSDIRQTLSWMIPGGRLFKSLSAWLPMGPAQLQHAVPFLYPKGLAGVRGYQYTERFKELQQEAAKAEQPTAEPPAPAPATTEGGAAYGPPPVEAAPVEIELPVTGRPKVQEPEPVTLSAKAEGQTTEVELPVTGRPEIKEPEPPPMVESAEGSFEEVEAPAPAHAPALILSPLPAGAAVEAPPPQVVHVHHYYDYGIHYHGGNGYEPSPRYEQVG